MGSKTESKYQNEGPVADLGLYNGVLIFEAF